MRLVADIGGTNARFATVRDGALFRTIRLKVADHTTGVAALAAAASALELSDDLDGVSLAVAGPLDGNRIALTNGDWSFDTAEVSNVFDGAPVTLYNDVQAAALGLPYAPPETIYSVSGDAVDYSQPVTLMMAGTGLGVACLVPGESTPIALATESGHMPLAFDGDDTVLSTLHQRNDPLTAEHVLSGAGLSRVYGVLSGEPDKDPAAIVAAAEHDDTARAAVAFVCRVFGIVAGTLVLAHGSWGGVCVSGSVGQALKEFLPASDFCSALRGRGRFADRLSQVPVAVVETDDLALMGLANA